MRRIVNLMKLHMYERYIPEHSTVLDLCCGKGQDLLKYAKRQVNRAWMIDQSQVQLDEAKKRYLEMKHNNRLAYKGLLCEFFCKDLTTGESLRVEPRVNVISCQLALHYLWGSMESRELLAATIDASLASDGCVLVTIIDADRYPAQGFALSSPTLSYSRPYLSDAIHNIWAYEFRFPEVVDHVQESLIPRYGLLDMCLELQLMPVQAFHFDDKRSDLLQMDHHLQAGESDIAAIAMYQCIAFQRATKLHTPRLYQALRIRKTIRDSIVKQWASLTTPETATMHKYNSVSSSLVHIAWVVCEYV